MGQAAVPSHERIVRGGPWIAAVVTGGALAALTLGFISASNTTDQKSGYFQLWWSDPIHLKAWLAVLAALLACVQVFTAAWIFRVLPLPRNRGVNVTHRWSGRLAFLATLPIAYHCIFKLGFHGDRGTRVLVHSLAGCAFYGAFTTKIWIVKLHDFPRWVLPVVGGLVFSTLVAAWYTSAHWFFNGVGESW